MTASLAVTHAAAKTHILANPVEHFASWSVLDQWTCFELIRRLAVRQGYDKIGHNGNFSMDIMSNRGVSIANGITRSAPFSTHDTVSQGGGTSAWDALAGQDPMSHLHEDLGENSWQHTAVDDAGVSVSGTTDNLSAFYDEFKQAMSAIDKKLIECQSLLSTPDKLFFVVCGNAPDEVVEFLKTQKVGGRFLTVTREPQRILGFFINSTLNGTDHKQFLFAKINEEIDILVQIRNATKHCHAACAVSHFFGAFVSLTRWAADLICQTFTNADYAELRAPLCRAGACALFWDQIQIDSYMDNNNINLLTAFGEQILKFFGASDPVETAQYGEVDTILTLWKKGKFDIVDRFFKPTTSEAVNLCTVRPEQIWFSSEQDLLVLDMDFFTVHTHSSIMQQFAPTQSQKNLLSKKGSDNALATILAKQELGRKILHKFTDSNTSAVFCDGSKCKAGCGHGVAQGVNTEGGFELLGPLCTSHATSCRDSFIEEDAACEAAADNTTANWDSFRNSHNQQFARFTLFQDCDGVGQNLERRSDSWPGATKTILLLHEFHKKYPSVACMWVWFPAHACDLVPVLWDHTLEVSELQWLEENKNSDKLYAAAQDLHSGNTSSIDNIAEELRKICTANGADHRQILVKLVETMFLFADPSAHSVADIIAGKAAKDASIATTSSSRVLSASTIRNAFCKKRTKGHMVDLRSSWGILPPPMPSDMDKKEIIGPAISDIPTFLDNKGLVLFWKTVSNSSLGKCACGADLTARHLLQKCQCPYVCFWRRTWPGSLSFFEHKLIETALDNVGRIMQLITEILTATTHIGVIKSQLARRSRWDSDKLAKEIERAWRQVEGNEFPTKFYVCS